MDPAIAAIGTTALEKAAASVKDQLDRVDRASRENRAACLALLSCCSTAVRGLEEEVDEILAEAKIAALHHPTDGERFAALDARIESYLHRTQLQLLLKESIEGLDACLGAIHRDLHRFFGWSATAEQHEVTAHLVAVFGELVDYLKRLNGSMTYSNHNFWGPSGVDLPQLLELQDAIRSDRAAVSAIVDRARERRHRDGMELVSKIAGLIRALTVAFGVAAPG